MVNYNGSDTGLAVILGELRAESRHQTAAIGQVIQAIERQNDILLELPTRLATTISIGSARPGHTRRLLPELSELVRTLYPPLAILAAILGKATWPTALPMIRAALEAAVKAGGA